MYFGSSSVLVEIVTFREGNSASGYNSISKYLYENNPIMVKPMKIIEISTLRFISLFIFSYLESKMSKARKCLSNLLYVFDFFVKNVVNTRDHY